jgi:hypothetical protein
MIEKYLVDGKPFSVHSSQKEAFLKKYPNAVLQKEPVEKKPVETTEEVSLQVDSETLEQSKKFTKKIYKDYNVQDFNDFPKEIKNQFLTEQFEANELDVEESFNMLKRQKEIEDKEAQLSKFFQETKRVQSETGNLPAYDVGGQFDSEYKPTKEELENPLYQDFFNPDGTIKSKDEITLIRDEINNEEELLLESGEYKDVDKIAGKGGLYQQELAQKQLDTQINIGITSKKIQDDVLKLNDESVTTFGVGLSALKGYDFKNQEQVDTANGLVNEAIAASKVGDTLQKEYQQVQLFYNNRENKQMQASYAEDWEGVANEFKKGWSQGKLVNAYISYDLGRGFNTENKGDYEQIIKTIVEENQKQSKMLTNQQYAKFLAAANSNEVISSEQAELLSDHYGQIGLSLLGNTFSQLLSVGRYVVPASIVAGGATGFGVGSLAANPFTAGAGALLGAGQGLKIGMAATNAAIEYGNSLNEAIINAGYDMSNPAEIEKGLQDKEVWQEGRKIGLSRGLAIGTVDYFMNGLAGFTYRSTASGLRKAGGILLEGAVVQPLGEGFGELAAQGAGFAVAGKEINLSEVGLETLGGFFAKTPNLAFNVAYKNSNFYNKKLAGKLANNLDFVIDDNESAENLNAWADKMFNYKDSNGNSLINEETRQKIKDNASNLKNTKEAYSNTNVKGNFRTRKNNKSKIKNRFADLYLERQKVNKAIESSTDTSQTSELKKIAQNIDNEIKTIQRTGQLVEVDSFKTTKDIVTLAQGQALMGQRILKQKGIDVELINLENTADVNNLEGLTSEDKQRILDGDVAINTGTQIIINNQAIRNGALNSLRTMAEGDVSAFTAYSHEILHSILGASFDAKEITEISKNLKKYVESEALEANATIPKRVLDRINKRMQKYSGESQQDQDEEYITALSDEIASGAIKWENQNKSFWNNIAEQINDYLGTSLGMSEAEITSFDITDGKKAFDFIASYSKSFSKGRIKDLKAVKRKEAASSRQLSQLVIESKEKNNLENKSLKNQYELIALKALGFIAGGGTVKRKEAVSFVNQYFPGIIRRYDPEIDKDGNITRDFSTFVDSNIRPKKQKFYQEEIGDKAQTTSLDDERAGQIADESEPTVTQPDTKVRKAKSFTNLKNITEDVIVVLDSKIKSVLSNIPIRTATPNVIIDKITTLVNKNLFKDIKEGMGKITKPGGIVTISPEYQAYHDNNFKEIVEAIPLKSAKSKYKTLFKVEKIGREKDKKVDPITKKVTYPGTGIFSVEIPKKGAFGAYHTIQRPGMGQNTLIERQTSLAKEIAKGIAAEIVDTYIEDNLTTLTSDMRLNEQIAFDNKIDQIKAVLDPNSTEQRKFDKVKSSKQLESAIAFVNATPDQVMNDFKNAINSGIEPNVVASAIANKYNIEEILFNDIVKALEDLKKQFPQQSAIGPEQFIEIAKQENPDYDQQQLDYAKDWDVFLKNNKLEKYQPYSYKESDSNYLQNKKAFTKELVNFMSTLPVELINHPMFKGSLSNSTLGASFFTNSAEVDAVIKLGVNAGENKNKKQININLEKVKFTTNIARDLAVLSKLVKEKSDQGKPLNNKQIQARYNKIFASNKISIKEVRKTLKFINSSINDYFQDNNKSEAVGKFITTWMKMQTNFSKGIFRGGAQFESMSMSPGVDTGKTGGSNIRDLVKQTLNSQLPIKYGLSEQEFRYLTGKSYGPKKNIELKQAVEAKFGNTTEIKKIIKDQMQIPKEYHGEHDIALMLFTTNVFNSMTDGNFDTKYDEISRYYSQTLLNEADRIIIDAAWGKTGNSPDFYFGMMPEIRFTEIIPNIAKDIFMFNYGTTLDQVILNKLALKDSLDANDLTKKLVQQLKKSISSKDLKIINDNNSAINNIPTIKNTFSELITHATTEIINDTDNTKSKTTNVKLIAQIENKNQVVQTQKANEKIIKKARPTMSTKNLSNNSMINEMKDLDIQAQEARTELGKSQDLNNDFNEIIERATGIGREKQYGKTKARAVGADKGRFDFLGIPPSAQDFVGLTRYFAGKGKKGDETISWIKENFLDPFARANIDISNARVALANDFKGLKKLLKITSKDLNKKIPGEPYTVGNAIRVYTWTQQGMNVPGLSKADTKILNDYVNSDPSLQEFSNELITINKDNGYPKPQESWLAGTVTTDLLSGLNTDVRAKYLTQWQDNVNKVFTEENLNKLEAAYGKGYREALENILGRMKTGTNRGFKGDSLTGRFIDWINGSVGAIMFFNMRSAVLQTISAVNFVNWSDNNPLKAAAAFANQPQFWGDVVSLMNSDYLVERRNGLKINVSEADIAEIAAESKNKAKAFIAKILKLGFLPTQIADSFAIASGGATFYRNRTKSYMKNGMSQQEAESQAFQDFREISEESQQSSRPDRISSQQAGPMGRIILAFANTPAQYARLMQKAASDLKNRRGDDKTNISKIIYYGAIQNVIFNALQQSLFAMAFDDEEPEEEKKNEKYTGIVNGMADSLLRGIGFHGAAVSTLKNVIMKLASGAKAKDAAIEMLDISPPVSSKIGKLISAGRTWDWNKQEIMEKGFSLDNPAWLASGQVVSAATNIPLDRGVRKLQNLKDASDAENEEWIRVANALGWAKWELEWMLDKSKPSKSTFGSKKRGTTTRKTRGRKTRKSTIKKRK